MLLRDGSLPPQSLLLLLLPNDLLAVLLGVFVAETVGFCEVLFCLEADVSLLDLDLVGCEKYSCVVLLQEGNHAGVVLEGDLVGFGKGFQGRYVRLRCL